MRPSAVTRLLIPMLERPLVLDSPSNVDAVDSKLIETALHRLEADEVEKQIRRQIAAGRDHVKRELGDAHHLADRGVHLGVCVAIGRGRERERRPPRQKSDCARERRDCGSSHP